ncbi:MAG: PaaI family thioesterase [Alphaproteobacteria bacterium]|nr:PaaI family thioesterase [Alphaproteobacteria bacterium]
MSGYNATPLKPARNIPPPAGWRPAEQFDPFEAYLGPYFDRDVDGAKEFAFLIDDRHTNAQGVAHGGALLTFADAALGYALWDATDRAPCVTVSQQSSFQSSAVAGDLVTCRPEIVRKTREIVFMRADFRVGDKIVFTVTAIWKIWPKT